MKTKLDDKEVQALVTLTGHHVDSLETDEGVNPKDYLVHVFSSEEFYALCKLFGNIPAAYAEDMPKILRAVTKALPIAEDMVSKYVVTNE